MKRKRISLEEKQARKEKAAKIKPRKRVDVRKNFSTFDEASLVKEELSQLDGVDKVKIVLRKSSDLFDVVAYGPKG